MSTQNYSVYETKMASQSEHVKEPWRLYNPDGGIVNR